MPRNPTVRIKSRVRWACWCVLIRNSFFGKSLLSLRLENWKRWSISPSQTQFTALPAHHSSRPASRKRDVDICLRCNTLTPAGPCRAIWEAFSSYTKHSSTFLKSYLSLMPLRLLFVLLMVWDVITKPVAHTQNLVLTFSGTKLSSTFIVQQMTPNEDKAQ